MERIWCLFLLLFLAACDSGEPGRLAVMDFQGNEGEAVVRHVIAHLPVLEPEVPKLYCVVLGPRLMAARMDFAKRMDDLKLHFVSGDSLTLREPNKSIVDPASGLSPITLQLFEMKRTGSDSLEVVAGWAYKKTWERRRYKVTLLGPKGWQVVDAGRVEGNYVAEGK